MRVGTFQALKDFTAKPPRPLEDPFDTPRGTVEPEQLEEWAEDARLNAEHFRNRSVAANHLGKVALGTMIAGGVLEVVGGVTKQMVPIFGGFVLMVGGGLAVTHTSSERQEAYWKVRGLSSRADIFENALEARQKEVERREQEARARAEEAVQNLATGLDGNSGTIQRESEFIEVNGIRVKIRSAA